MKASMLVILVGIVGTTLHGLAGRAATIQFAATNYAGIEGSGISLQLLIDPPVTTTNASVRIAQTGGSASARDFYGLGYFGYPEGTILIPASQNQVSVGISLTDDGLPESNETLEFTLTDPAGGLALGQRRRVVVTIQNARPGFRFSWSSGFEATGVEVHCDRHGDTNGAFTVDYVTIANGSAVPGLNFMPTNGTIEVAAGQREMSFLIPVLNDGVVDPEGTSAFT